MNPEIQAADDAIYLTSGIIRTAATVSRKGAEFFAGLIDTVIKNSSKSRELELLRQMTSGGKEVVVFPLYSEHEGAFIREAERRNFQYCILKDKESKCEIYPLIVRKEDANKVNRMFETMNLSESGKNPLKGGAAKEKASEKNVLEMREDPAAPVNNLKITEKGINIPKRDNEHIYTPRIFDPPDNEIDQLLSGCSTKEAESRESVKKMIEEMRRKRQMLFDNTPPENKEHKNTREMEK